MTFTVTKGLMKEMLRQNTRRNSQIWEILYASFFLTDKAGDNTNYNFVEHPIAGLSIKDDGKMYVSLATNLSGMYSYEREALNYVPYYGSLGETIVCNNAQFKKCANAKEMIDMAHLIGDDHEYETVKVDPTCLRKGFSEERCKVCGRIKESESKGAEKQKYDCDRYGGWNFSICLL